MLRYIILLRKASLGLWTSVGSPTLADSLDDALATPPPRIPPLGHVMTDGPRFGSVCLVSEHIRLCNEWALLEMRHSPVMCGTPDMPRPEEEEKADGVRNRLCQGLHDRLQQFLLKYLPAHIERERKRREDDELTEGAFDR